MREDGYRREFGQAAAEHVFETRAACSRGAQDMQTELLDHSQHEFRQDEDMAHTEEHRQMAKHAGAPTRGWYRHTSKSGIPDGIISGESVEVLECGGEEEDASEREEEGLFLSEEDATESL
jgi:hypothetical protein